MIRSFWRAGDGTVRVELEREELAGALKDTQGLLWLDMQEEPVASCEPILREMFAFHPLAVEDALQESHVSKIDDWDSYLYAVVHAAMLCEPQHEEAKLAILELDLFVGPNYVVTHHDQPIGGLERVWASCRRDERRLGRSPAFLAYRLLDELVSDYMPVVERLEERIEWLEDEVFERPSPAILQAVLNATRQVLDLRRVLLPQREVMNRLARGDFAVIGGEGRVLFRDVYDSLIRVHDLNENLRELLTNAMDLYLSTTSNRLNETMRTLTMIATVFMPLSFIVGFFGMNFFQPVLHLSWTTTPVLVVTLCVLALTPAGMYLWARRRGWTRPSRRTPVVGPRAPRNG
jgi:magnesium transporter